MKRNETRLGREAVSNRGNKMDYDDATQSLDLGLHEDEDDSSTWNFTKDKKKVTNRVSKS